jgi:GT2 family glycosyltransferase
MGTIGNQARRFNMTEFAPIALFVYNRPFHTRQTVEALQKNDFSSDSNLIIFSDAPKSAAQTEAVLAVRQYIHQIEGFKSVTIIEQEMNIGLARSIIDGVTSLCEEYGRVIVLEDDIVVSPYFLDYMNAALEIYQDEEKVMHISGYMFPIDNTDLPETFFLRTPSCWGWATWDRAWRYFKKNPKQLLSGFNEPAIRRFNLDGAYNFWEQVRQNESGIMNSWAVFWYATLFQKGGLCLHPKFSMTHNIGHDDSGVHCTSTSKFDVHLASKPITYFEDNLTENKLVLKKLKAYFSPGISLFLSMIWHAIKNSFLAAKVK